MASRGRGHSCEPGRKAAYSENIRWRMVWQHQVQGLTLDQVATNLCVDTSNVHRIVSRFQATGVVSKKPYSVVNRIVKLTNAVQLTVLNLVLEKPGIYLWEIQQEVMWICGAYLSPSSLCTQSHLCHFILMICLFSSMKLVATVENMDMVYEASV